MKGKTRTILVSAAFIFVLSLAGTGLALGGEQYKPNPDRNVP
jgi:hypothetical protein